MKPTRIDICMKYNNRRFARNESLSIHEFLALIAKKTNYPSKLYGKGWQCRCPAHEDKKPSLSVAVGDGGIILARCFAHCTIQEICDAVGVRVCDLFPKKRNKS